MKTFTIKITIFLVLFLSFATSFSQDKIKIGFSLGNATEERWKKDRTFFEKIVNEMDGVVYFESTKNDSISQLQQVKSLLKRGIKVLVVVASNGDSAAAIVQEAHKYGVKVVAYDRLIKNCDLDYYISYDSRKVGELQANYITKIKPEGNFMIINGPVMDYNSTLIRQGQSNILSSFVKSEAVKIIYEASVDFWSREEAFKLVNGYLIKNNIKPDVILVADDEMAIGAINALRNFKLDGKVLVTGQDADLESCRAIIDGNQVMTVYKPIKPLAFSAAMAVMNIAQDLPVLDAIETINNGKLMVPSVILTPFLVDKNNIKTNIIVDGHLTESEIYKR